MNKSFLSNEWINQSNLKEYVHQSYTTLPSSSNIHRPHSSALYIGVEYIYKSDAICALIWRALSLFGQTSNHLLESIVDHEYTLHNIPHNCSCIMQRFGPDNLLNILLSKYMIKKMTFTN